MGCPCCLPQVPPSIKLEKPDGVTKIDLIDAVAAYLYGDALPSIYAQHSIRGFEDIEEPWKHDPAHRDKSKREEEGSPCVQRKLDEQRS